MIKTKIKIQKYTRICFEKSKYKTKYFIILQQQLGAHVIILLLLLLLLLPINLTSFVFPQKYEEAKTFCLFVQWWNLYEILLMFQQINFTDKAFCLVFCCALNWWKCYVFNVLQKKIVNEKELFLIFLLTNNFLSFGIHMLAVVCVCLICGCTALSIYWSDIRM